MASLIDAFNGGSRDMVDAAVQKDIKTNRHGYRLRASEIADPCERKLYAGLRWLYKPEQTDPRKQRIFDIGNITEDRVIADLKKVEDFEVIDTEWNAHKWRDEQIGVAFADGHGYGYLDLTIKGLSEAPQTWHVGEVKSANQTDFNALQKHGVKKKKPLWYGQISIYMLKQNFDRGIFFIECKNDQQRLFERVEFDYQYATQLEVKAERIVYAPMPPVRATADPSDGICLFCRAKEWCWADRHVDIPRTCRSCTHIEPISGGKWACNKVPSCARTLSRDEQEAGCKDYLVNPDMRHWAKLEINAGDMKHVYSDGHVEEVRP